jgi:SAM-dependent methyltransferase
VPGACRFCFESDRLHTVFDAPRHAPYGEAWYDIVSSAKSQVSQREELRSALGVLLPVLDIVDTPVDTPAAPGWCRERGWLDFLLSLGDDDLAASERGGFATFLAGHARAPAELREFGARVQRCTRLPALAASELPLPAAALRGVAARKRGQLAGLLGALSPLAANAERIVDVGAGRGHFSRLASELFQRQTVGLDRDAALLRSGGERSDQRARAVGPLRVRFVEADVGQQPLELQSSDLAVGLHACGELGDRLVLAAAAARCDVALVSCCLQKTTAARRLALSHEASGFELRRGALGLTNLTAREDGVEASLADNLRARQARLALRYLLRARGCDVGAGEEMRGVNRRRAQSGFADLAAHALALRQLPPPTPLELRSFADAAERDYAVIRRLSLPRSLLARLVELSIVRDRAVVLEEHGHAVVVAQLFDQRLTPRNTVLLASAQPDRLPALREQ